MALLYVSEHTARELMPPLHAWAIQITADVEKRTLQPGIRFIRVCATENCLFTLGVDYIIRLAMDHPEWFEVDRAQGKPEITVTLETDDE